MADTWGVIVSRVLPDSPTAPLVGRTEIVDLLRRRLLEPNAGLPRAALLAGETGAGKSRVAAAVADLASRAGCTVLTGRCICLGGELLPFVAFADVLRSIVSVTDAETLPELVAGHRDALAAICPEIGEASITTDPAFQFSAAGRLRLFQAVRTTLARMGARAPVLVVIEDAHWLSPTGVELLAFLLYAIPPQVAMLVTYASDRLPHDHGLRILSAELRRSGLADDVDLPLLGRADVDLLATQLLHAPVDLQLVDEAYRFTDGNPFLVEEFILRGHGGSSEWGQRLLEMVTPQLATLPATTRRVAQALAVGGPTPHNTLAAVMGCDDATLLSALHELVDAGLLHVTSDGSAHELRHVLLAEAVTAGLLPVEREQWHAAFACELAAQIGEDPAPSPELMTALVRHLDGAGQHDALLPWSLRAAAAWEHLAAFPEALDHYRRAIEQVNQPGNSGQSQVDPVELFARAAAVADLAGERAAAVTLIGQGLDALQSDDPRRVELLERQAWYLFLTGDATGGMRSCDAALAQIRERPVTAVRAQILTTHSRLLAMSGEPTRAISLARLALEEAQAVGDEVQSARAQVSLGVGMWQAGDVSSALVALRQACAEGERLADAETAGPAYVALSHLLLLGDVDLEPALELAVAGYERLKARQLHRQVAEILLMHAAHCCFELGRWDECVDHAQQSRAAGGRGARYATALLALLAAYRGEVLATDTVDRQWSDTLRDAPALVRVQGLRVAELYIALSRPADALDIVLAALDKGSSVVETVLVAQLCITGMCAVADLADDARARRDEVQLARAMRAAADIARRLRRAVPGALDAAETGDAAPLLATWWAAEHARAFARARPDMWESVAALADKGRRPRLRSYALCRQAEMLVNGRATRRFASPVLHDATAIAERLGDALLTARLSDLARAARLTPAESTTTKNGEHTVPLTVREIEVLALLADGLTNRSIAERLVIGMKTVDAHVSHIMQKLAVHDRVAAVDHARMLGLMQ